MGLDLGSMSLAQRQYNAFGTDSNGDIALRTTATIGDITINNVGLSAGTNTIGTVVISDMPTVSVSLGTDAISVGTMPVLNVGTLPAVSISSGTLTSVPTLNVGTMPNTSKIASFSVGTVSMGTDSAQIVASNGTRNIISIVNAGTQSVYLGMGTSSGTNALELKGGLSFSSDRLTTAFYGVTATGTCLISYLEA